MRESRRNTIKVIYKVSRAFNLATINQNTSYNQIAIKLDEIYLTRYMLENKIENKFLTLKMLPL